MPTFTPQLSRSAEAGPEELLGIMQAITVLMGLPWNPHENHALLMQVHRLAKGDMEIATALFKHALKKDRSLASLPEIKIRSLRKALKAGSLDGEILALLTLATAGLEPDELLAAGFQQPDFDKALHRLTKSDLLGIKDGRVRLTHPLLHQQGVFWLKPGQLEALVVKLVESHCLSTSSAGGLLASPFLPLRHEIEHAYGADLLAWLPGADRKDRQLVVRLLECGNCSDGLLESLLIALPVIPFTVESAQAYLQLLQRSTEHASGQKHLAKHLHHLLPALLAADELGQFDVWWKHLEGFLDDATKRRLFYDYALERILRVDPVPVAAMLERIGGRNWLLDGNDSISQTVLAFLELDHPLDRRKLLKLLITAMPSLAELPAGQRAALLRAALRVMQLEVQDAGQSTLKSLLPKSFAEDAVLDACLAMLAHPSPESIRGLAEELNTALSEGRITAYLVELVFLLQACVGSTHACPTGALLREMLVVLEARPLDQLSAWFRVEVALLLFATGEWEQGAHWLDLPGLQHKALQAIEKELLIARFLLLEARSTESLNLHEEQQKLLLQHRWIHGQNDHCPCLRLLEALGQFRSGAGLPDVNEMREILDGIQRLPVCRRAPFLSFLHELALAGDGSWDELKQATRQILAQDPLSGPMILVCHKAREARRMEDRIGVRHLLLDAVLIALERGYPGWIRQLHRQFPRVRLEGLISGRSRDGLTVEKRARLAAALKRLDPQGIPVRQFGLDLRGQGRARLLQQLNGGDTSEARATTRAVSGHDLELSLVGRLKIVAGGEAITGKHLGRGKLRELICFLLVERWRHPGRSWQAEDLVARIWHETRDPGKVLNSFYVYMSNAKRFFSEIGLPDAIERKNGGYLISHNLSLTVDLDALDAFSRLNLADESQAEMGLQRRNALEWVLKHAQSLDPTLRGKWLDELRAWHEAHYMKLVRHLRDSLEEHGDLASLQRIEASFFRI